MLDEINNQFDLYKSIFKKVSNNRLYDDEESLKTRTLLENSLHLSVFTSFESFLKKIIANYIYNLVHSKRRNYDLPKEVVYKMFLNKRKIIERIVKESGSDSENAFESFRSFMNDKPLIEELEKHIHYEFLHSDKINNYYPFVFKLLFGDPNYLKNLTIKAKYEFDNLSTEVIEDAYTFVSNYTDKVRNNIAHQNERFSVENSFDFEYVIDTFYYIMSEMIKEYEKNTGYRFDSINDDNLIE